MKEVVKRWCLVNDIDYSFFLGACIFWAIWKIRNETMFKNATPEVQYILKIVLHRFSKYYNNDDGDASLDSHLPVSSCTNPNLNEVVSWPPPSGNFIKINMDVSIRDAQDSCATVARNSGGHIMSYETALLGFITLIAVEAMGFIIVPNLAERLKYSYIIIENDYEVIVKILKGQSLRIPWRIQRLIEDILKGQ